MSGYSTSLRNARADAITAAVAAGGKLRIYSGTQPATGGAVTTQIVNDFTLGSPFAPAAAGGVLSPTLPSASTGSATGTATWFRVFKADGTTPVIDGTVGTSGADMNLNTTSISAGLAVSITSWSVTGSNP
jgi:hypothetical protein